MYKGYSLPDESEALAFKRDQALQIYYELYDISHNPEEAVEISSRQIIIFPTHGEIESIIIKFTSEPSELDRESIAATGFSYKESEKGCLLLKETKREVSGGQESKSLYIFLTPDT